MIDNKFKHTNREQWLIAAVDLMRPLFQEKGKPIPDAVQVSTGWPSKSALSNKARRIGECWDATTAEDHRPHIFISPILDNGETRCPVLDVLHHELIHAAVGCKCGHKGPFKRLAKSFGLEGKMTATTAGPELLATLKEFSEKLGPYPHGTLHSLEKKRTKRDECRMLKCECVTCGYVVRTTKKWLEDKGAPICPCNHQTMGFDAPDTDTDTEENED